MVFLSPAGLATAPVANQLPLTAHYIEKFCACNGSSIINTPKASVTYTVGTPTLKGTTLFIPILAVITIVNHCGCGCSVRPGSFTENFEVTFQGYSALPSSVTVNSLGTLEGNTCRCGKCYFDIYDSINIVVTPATAAA